MSSTQSFIPIKTIKNDTVVLKNGSLRAVLMASGLNFSLMSEDEQNAIIARYQEFLNSLDFSVQILVQSRRLNIKKYITLLDSQKTKQPNELLQIQLQEYIQFIKTLTKMTHIMVKMFYVIIPFYTIEARKSGILTKIKKSFGPETNSREKKETFLQKKDQLRQRVEFVQQTLRGTGIQLVPLKTQELIELYYSLYNPGSTEREELGNIENLNIQ